MGELDSEKAFFSLIIGITLFTILLVILIVLIILRFKARQARLKDELRIIEQQAQLEEIIARLKGGEQERIRVAQVLHDGIASQLTAADFQLSALRTESTGAYAASIDRTVDLIRDTSSQVRELSHELVPPVLLKLGLIPALEDLCYKYLSLIHI